MKEENKILIENEVLQLTKLTLEASTKQDRFGNIFYEDIDSVTEKIREIILKYSEELQEEKEEVKEYLLKLLNKKTDNVNKQREHRIISEIIQSEESSKEKISNNEKDTKIIKPEIDPQ